MRIEIIAIGSELTAGVTVDTNSALLAKKLRDVGLEVSRVTLVSDGQEDMEEIFQEVFKRADAAVVTGGLGPTEDDRTRFAAAKIAGLELEEDPESIKRLEQIFQAFGRDMPKSNIWQAMFPKGSRILENPIGTARGFAMEHEGCLALFGPGVPREIKAMIDYEIVPILKERSGIKVAISTKTLRCFGLPESELADRLDDFVKLHPDVELGYSAKFPTIDLRMSAKGENIKQADARIQGAGKYIQDLLGDRIFGQGENTMAFVTAKELIKNGFTVSLAESCTGGMIAAALTDIPGSSAYFLEGAVTYSDQAKVRMLGVKPETIEKFGAVSKETAVEMAIGAREKSAANIGLSVTGIAGPDGGTPEKPVGLVHMALSFNKDNGQDKILHWENRFPGGRNRVRKLTVYAALDRIRQLCKGGKSPLDTQFNCTD